MIKSINNIGIAVKDLDRSVDFYQQLGFAISYRTDAPGAAMACGTVVLYLFQSTSSLEGPKRTTSLPDNPPGFDHLSLDVDDVDVVYQELKEKISFESEPENQSWGSRACSFLDPDGNRIYLLSPLT